MSQGSVASELGLDQGTVSRVESGQRPLSIGEAFGWFAALGEPPEQAARILASLYIGTRVESKSFWEGSAWTPHQ